MITSEKSLRRYCTNFKVIENYEEAVQSHERYDLHHRKGIETLEDGTSVIRSMHDLKDLNLYYHRPPEELIFLKHSEHITLHDLANNPMSGKTGDKNPMYGKKHSAETKAKLSAANTGEKNHMYGLTGENHHSWKGDLASDHAKYMRVYRQKKRAATSSLSTS